MRAASSSEAQVLKTSSAPGIGKEEVCTISASVLDISAKPDYKQCRHPRPVMNNVVRRITYFAVAAIFGVLALFALRGPQGIPALMEKRRAIRAMEEQNAQLEQQIETKQKYIEKLKHSA